MTVLANLRVFATHPHECSYLPEQRATTLFVDPNAGIDAHLYSRLSELGFRRSGSHLYRPHCGECRACVPARVPVAAFRPDRQQRRIWRRNADLVTADARGAMPDDEIYDLYARYISARHQDGDMYPPSRDQFEAFLTRQWGVTRFVCFRERERLLAVAVVDVMDNGLSAIYTFFEPGPEVARRSLGSYAVLWQIEEARRLGLPSLYLGYWIRQCRKMAYKTRFRPVELLIDGHWQRLA